MSAPPAPPVVELGAPTLGEEERRALLAVLDDGWLTMGPRVRRFEEEFAALHGVPDAVAVGSGTAALQLALTVLGIGPGDEVLVPSATFVATASAVVRVGARPVFADVVDARTPHLSLADAAARRTARTRAVVVVHYGGYALDLTEWRAFADAHGLALIEDAAHAAGLVGYVGTVSDAAAFSFFANKNMTTAEGGMLLVGDPDRRARARLLRAHGMTTSTLERDRGRAGGYDVVEAGHNFRMDELRGALGLVQLPRLAGWNAVRGERTRRYRELLADEVPEVTVPFAAGHPTAAHLLPVLLPRGTDREAVRAALRAAGVQSSVHYPPVHRFTHFLRTHGGVRLPATEAFADAELTLPLHPRLSDADVVRVVGALRSGLDAAGGTS